MQPRTALLLRNCRPSFFRAHSALRRYATAAAGEPEIYDVVCVGGGPAGLSLLTALRASPSTAHLKVALVESQDLEKNKLQNEPLTRFSNRCSSLTPASVSNLKRIGAWEHIDSSRVQPYQEMQVWDGVSNSRISFDWPSVSPVVPRSSPSSTTIAYMIENINLTTGLLKRLSNLGGVSIFSPVRVDSINLGTDTPDLDLSSWPIVTLSDGRKLAARLLVGADGANSPVRTFAGITSRGWDYNRHGVVATLRLDGLGWGGQDYKIAYQRFLPSGPVAMLPLPGNMATLVWSTLPERAALLKSLKKDDFVAMVNAAFRLSPVDLDYLHTMSSGQASEIEWREKHTSVDAKKIPMRVVDVQEGTVAPFPLRLRHADTYIGERVALVGDAAHTIHPLAGQGLNAGQADVASLASTLAAACTSGADIGSSISLEAYTSDRYVHNNALLGVCDKLHKLYSFNNPAVVGVRSLGLDIVDKLGPLKSWFMKQAAGG